MAGQGTFKLSTIQGDFTMATKIKVHCDGKKCENTLSLEWSATLTDVLRDKLMFSGWTKLILSGVTNPRTELSEHHFCNDCTEKFGFRDGKMFPVG